MVLEDFLSQAAAPSSFRELLKRDYVRSEIAPPPSGNDWVRASGMSYLCAREKALAASRSLDGANKIKADLYLAFALGHGMHWAMQNRVLGQLGILRGRWRCTRCGDCIGGFSVENVKEVSALKKRMMSDEEQERFRVLMRQRLDSLEASPEGCQSCGRKNGEYGSHEYEEIWLGDPEFRIGGHPDGFLRLPWIAGLGIFELKSIAGHMAWKVRHVPQYDHVIQVHVYMWLTGFKWALIVYWSKDIFGIRGLLEHFVPRDEETIAKIKGNLRELWAGVRGEFLPDRICASPQCDRAKECALKKLCFQEGL